MKKLINLISEEVTKAFVSAGYDEKYGKVTLSNRPDLCEYQCNGAMAGAKLYKKAPLVIAQDVAKALNENPDMVFKTLVTVSPTKNYYVFLDNYIILYYYLWVFT